MEKTLTDQWTILSLHARQFVSQMANIDGALAGKYLSTLFPEMEVDKVIRELEQVGLIEQTTYVREKREQLGRLPYVAATILDRDLETLSEQELHYLSLITEIAKYELESHLYPEWDDLKYRVVASQRAAVLELADKDTALTSQ